MSKTVSRPSSVIPGLGLSLGFTLFYLSIVVLIPLSTLFVKSAGLSWKAIGDTLTAPRTVSAIELSLLGALAAAVINMVFGLIVAWVLVRYEFPGRKLLDGLVD